MNSTETMDKRRYPRLNCSTDAVLTVGRRLRRKDLSATIMDLSETGARLAVGDGAELKPGSRLTLKWRVDRDGKKSEISRAGVVSRAVSRQDGDGPNTVYGVRFERLIGEHNEESSSLFSNIAAAACVLMAAVVIFYIKLQSLHLFWYAPLLKTYS